MFLSFLCLRTLQSCCNQQMLRFHLLRIWSPLEATEIPNPSNLHYIQLFVSHFIQHYQKKSTIPLPSFMVIPGHSSTFDGEKAPASVQGNAPRFPDYRKNCTQREESQDHRWKQRTKPSKNERFNILISHIFPVHCLEYVNQINHFQPVTGHKVAEAFSTGSDQNTCTGILKIFLLRLKLLKQQ